MKRKLSLIVFLGIVLGAVLTGCNQQSESPGTSGGVTNAPASTNATPP